MSTSIPDDLFLKADARLLRQIILNLLSNALKFTEEGGVCAIKSVINDDGSLSISIRDNGIGMSEEGLEKAMSRFGQVDSSLSKKYQGTGLGLPLTKEMTEIQSGKFAIESEVGEGTTVTLTFPQDLVSNGKHQGNRSDVA